jgi:MoaA/NifB/PqqE/SkfB family radical SAM enzyme
MSKKMFEIKIADHSRSDFHLHTSGSGVTREIAERLKMAGLHAAGVGLDDCDPDRNDKLRGFTGAHEQAVRAIRCFQEAGIFTYVNTCLTKELANSGELLKYLEFLNGISELSGLNPGLAADILTGIRLN